MGSGDTFLSEHLEQREFVSWFRKTHPGVRIFAIPNGGWRGVAAGARLKAEGVSAGVPDLFIPEWRVWIEMKRAKGGVLSEKQKGWRDYLIGCGYKVIVAHGKIAAQDEIIALHRSDLVK
jgi:hypothetical protein